MKKFEPITESYYYILLCLAKGPNHGYGIMQKVSEISKGLVKIGSGTMYGATSNMLKKGWIVEVVSLNDSYERKRMYEITNLGKNVLDEEIQRLKKLLDAADRMNVI